MSLAPSAAQLIKMSLKMQKSLAAKRHQPAGAFVLCCSSPNSCPPVQTWKEVVALLKEHLELGKQCAFPGGCRANAALLCAVRHGAGRWETSCFGAFLFSWSCSAVSMQGRSRITSPPTIEKNAM